MYRWVSGLRVPILAIVIFLSFSEMNEIADKITLQRNHESHEMLMAQVCARNLKRIFQVSMQT